MDFESPDFRAVVRRDGTIRLVDWGPWMARGGPLQVVLESRARSGIAIADLTVVRDSENVAIELIVSFACGGIPAHREALLEWAARIGYRRLWFPGDVVDLDPAPGGGAETRCSACRARLVDSGTSFWEFVRHRGAFPTACVLCGSDLPQWVAAREARPDSEEILQVGADADDRGV